MNDFDDIRPYRDDEARPILDRILAAPELHAAVAALLAPRLNRLAPRLVRPLVKWLLRRRLAGVQTVDDWQKVVAHYLGKMIERKTRGVTASGVAALQSGRPCLFISNHRDIAMDPAFINWILFQNNLPTQRIAIGDNLLTKPYVSDLMRLNKSFIVNRSARAPREKLKAAKHLSSYIHHSLVTEGANVWIAQREGRAKDGRDKTNPAVLSMIALSKPKAQPLGDYIRELNIVPVSLSYEWDPCDLAKTRELHLLKTLGSYEKAEHEDVASIAAGIGGDKGHVHLAFGTPLDQAFETTDQVAAELDRQILANYLLHPSNCLAYQLLTGDAPKVAVGVAHKPFAAADYPAEQAELERRMAGLSPEQRDIFLGIYANPVKAKLVS